MAKTPQQAAQKWDASTQLGGQTWATNLQNTQKPIVSAAIAQRSVMQSNFNQATQPGGIWEQRLSAVGDQGIKQAAANSIAQYQSGVSRAQPKFLTAITKILAYEN